MQEVMDGDEVRKLANGDFVPKRPMKQACPDEIEIELPMLPQATRPNSRVHWSKKAKAVKKQRSDAATCAAIVLRNVAPPRWESATVEITLHRPHKNCRKSDPDNIIGWCKGSFDGLQDADLISTDANLIHLPPKQLLGKDASETKVVLRICRRGGTP